MTWNDHDHSGEYAPAGHDHNAWDVHGAAEENHRHYDTERDISGLGEEMRSLIAGLREDLDAALARIGDLENAATHGRCPAGEPARHRRSDDEPAAIRAEAR